MKSLITALIAALVFLTGCEPEVQRAVEPPKEPALLQQGPKKQHVTCPNCRGEKTITSTSGLQGTRQPCPICTGRGFREVTIPDGKTICADCKGMGIVGRASNESLSPRGPTIAGNNATNLPNKTTCSNCLGSGVAAKPVKK
ncbi:MAG: hypothetical protein RL088_847 [Verrucomicrobiota bacterium]|jgi:DnaJ-class molecular chaperone